MKFTTRIQILFDRFRKRYAVAKDKGLYETSALIRLEARQSMRIRKAASPPGRPPSAHTRGGLREINFHVSGNSSVIGPRKFSSSKFFNRPVPNIHEKGGPAINRYRGYVMNYPERSFMWAAVKSLQSKGKIASRFRITLARNL